MGSGHELSSSNSVHQNRQHSQSPRLLQQAHGQTGIYTTPPDASKSLNPITNVSSSSTQQRTAQQQQPARPVETDTLKLKKAWEIALAPSKQIPMNAIMMYMSGNSLQIFSIMMVFMLFKGPIQGLLATNSAFAKFENENTKARLVGVKVVYVLMQLLLLALGIWKVNAMGLLPYVMRPPQ
ncbi:conserved hypothetical protein [Paecilomyces variotii No. 5]|uniref:ER membrane protein complex subunit 4 n=1 Tax=Byssochlamys spectabilis (strain No. 5 / NBRC 109023) TaxID=1356009 RepID=V5FP74_BYSSN|nr:conserved hypothetical protein [Paecilomyces variotii No. 5]